MRPSRSDDMPASSGWAWGRPLTIKRGSGSAIKETWTNVKHVRAANRMESCFISEDLHAASIVGWRQVVARLWWRHSGGEACRFGRRRARAASASIARRIQPANPARPSAIPYAGSLPWISGKLTRVVALTKPSSETCYGDSIARIAPLFVSDFRGFAAARPAAPRLFHSFLPWLPRLQMPNSLRISA